MIPTPILQLILSTIVSQFILKELCGGGSHFYAMLLEVLDLLDLCVCIAFSSYKISFDFCTTAFGWVKFAQKSNPFLLCQSLLATTTISSSSSFSNTVYIASISSIKVFLLKETFWILLEHWPQISCAVVHFHNAWTIDSYSSKQIG